MQNHQNSRRGSNAYRWMAIITVLVFLAGSIPAAVVSAAAAPAPVAPASVAAASVAAAPAPSYQPQQISDARPAQPLQAGDGQFESAPCMFSVPAGYQEGKDVSCGWLIVPEQHANPNGPTIRLAVAIFKSRAANPQPDPLVMAQGGPGGSTIDIYSQLIPLDPRLANLDRDIVLFDQRGTLYSKPALTCPEVLDMTIATLDQDLTVEESTQKSLQALQSCHDRLVKEGVNLSAFDSLENAADVESLRLTLGYDKINLYGVSYGTLLALHVLRQYSAGLRSVIIDSVVPPQTNFVIDAPFSQNRALEAVFDGCANQPACNSRYPNLRQVFYEVYDRLNEQKSHQVLTDYKESKEYPALIDGTTFFNAIIQMLYATDLVPMIPRVIYQVKDGDFTLVNRILSLVVFDHTMSEGMYYSVVCSENNSAELGKTDYSPLPDDIEQYQKEGAEAIQKTCGFWKVDPLDALAKQPVASDVPTLILSGSFDPITPPDYAKLAASTLPNSYFVEFPIGGHGELTSGACQDSVVLAFLDNPAQKPDSSCATAQKMEFTTPFTILHFPALLGLLNLSGSMPYQLGAYGLSVLFLLTGLLIYPIVWLVRMIRGSGRKTAPAVTAVAEGVDAYGAPVDALYSGSTEPVPVVTTPRRKPFLYRFAPWLNALAALSLLGFIIVVYVVALQMALSNDNRFLMGLPGSTAPLFILPYLAILCAVGMTVGMVSAWARRAGSVAGRLYLTLLCIAAWISIAVLGYWGVLTTFFAR